MFYVLAATTLLDTHTNYQHYFTNVVVPHASTQGTRHQKLAQGFSDYLAQTPRDVYKLPKPMAALGVLGLQALASASVSAPPAPPDTPPAWISNTIQWAENTEQDLENDEENVPDGPADPAAYVILAIMLVVVIILLLALASLGIWELWDHLFGHQNQQKNTSTKKPPAKPTATPTPNGLTPAQKREVDDTIAEATKDGYSVDQSDIEALVKAGYKRDTIIKMLKAGNLKNSQGKSHTASNGHVYPAHTSAHIGIPAADLKSLTEKNNKAGGKGIATSFPDEATAQNAVYFAIAHSTALQNFIQAGVPGSDISETVCESSKDFGYGYQRNVLPNGTINPPTHLPHLHCVTVWLAVDASGNVFVVDAYPSMP